MKPWLKLWGDILTDPKMGMMSDRLWRRTIELFLLASRQVPVDDGSLPTVNEIAWTLRTDPEQLETEMIELMRVGVLSSVDGRWQVRNYDKWQAPMSDAERMRYYRRRQKVMEELEEGDTATVTNVTKPNESVTNPNIASEPVDDLRQDGRGGVTNPNENVTNGNENRYAGVTLTVQETEQNRTETETESESDIRTEATAIGNRFRKDDDDAVIGDGDGVNNGEMIDKLERIGFTGAGQWIANMEDDQCRLVWLWLDYLESLNGSQRRKIENPAGLMRVKVGNGEGPPKIRKREAVPAKYAHLVKR